MDDSSLAALAEALYEDEVTYLLDKVSVPDLSGAHGYPEDEVILSAVRNTLRSFVKAEGVLRVDLEDDHLYGEGAELEPQATLALLKRMPRTKFIFVRGEEFTRGEHIPAYAEIRTGAETWHAPIQRRDGEWRAYVPEGRSDLETAVAEVNAALTSGI